jgi:hypothetical protein
MIQHISVDAGKFSTKAVKLNQDGTEKRLLFRTKLEETIKNEAQGKSYIVTYCGKKYLIGEQAEANSAKLSKAEELHRICTYTALHQLGNSGEEHVVAIGCPLVTFENPESREEFKRFMFPDKQIDIKVGDLVKHLYIKAVIVLPESSGVIDLEPEKYTKGLVGVVDLGGLNINACAYNKGIPVLSTLYTDSLGSNVLTANLMNALNTKYNENFPQFMMDDIVNEGYVIDNMREDGIKEGSQEFIANFKKRHIQTILKKCEANGWNLSMMRLVFTGGTSQMLATEIKELLPGATIYQDSIFSNARGFLKVITE